MIKYYKSKDTEPREFNYYKRTEDGQFYWYYNYGDVKWLKVIEENADSTNKSYLIEITEEELMLELL